MLNIENDTYNMMDSFIDQKLKKKRLREESLMF